MKLIYRPYSKEYKILMLKYSEERIQACKRNIFTFETMLKICHWSLEIQAQYLIKINQERNLLKFLMANNF